MCIKTVKNIKNNKTNAEPEMSAQERVQRYVLKDPKTVMCDYELWSLCEKVPVAIEDSNDQGTGFCRCVEMPTKVILPLTRMLKKASKEVVKDPKSRTISFIYVSANCAYVVIHNLVNSGDTPYLVGSYGVLEKGKLFNICKVNPEINKLIVEEMKVHSR